MSVQQMLAPSYTATPTEQLVGYKEKKSFFGDLHPFHNAIIGAIGGKKPIYETRDVYNPTENPNYTDMVDYAYKLLNPNLYRK